MSVGLKNLSGTVRSRLDQHNPAHIGQPYYLVDSDYRTAAQGWANGERTGPLDLWSEREPGHVFRTGDYSTDGIAIQAAIDALVDFRGDDLCFTPGSYSIATTALAVNVPDARWIGPVVGDPRAARATITAAVAAAIGLTAAADRMEVANLKFVPLTASHIFGVASGANNLVFRDFFYDTTGVAANVATQFMLAAGSMDNTVFRDFVFRTDAAHGPFVEMDGAALGVEFRNFYHSHIGATTLAISLLDVDGATASGITVGPGFGQIGHTAATGIVTTLIDLVDMTVAATNITVREFDGSVGYATTTTLVTSAGAVNDIDIVDSWIATVEGGAGRAAYVGAAA